eukprot:scaffold79275_cov84-Phaeocystis_antarctica.AAC.1
MGDYRMARVYHRAVRPQLSSPAAHGSGGGAAVAAVAACVTCGSDQDEPGHNDILLCDACDAGYHMRCLQPPLEVVPPGDWFCAQCEQRSAILAGAVLPAGAVAGASTALGGGAAENGGVAEGGGALMQRGDAAGANAGANAGAGAGAGAALSAVVVSEFEEDAVKVEAVVVDLEDEDGEEGPGVEVE